MVFLSKVKVKCFQVFPPFLLFHCGSFHMNENVNFTVTVPENLLIRLIVSFSESHNEYDNLIRLMECAHDERLIVFYFF